MVNVWLADETVTFLCSFYSLIIKGKFTRIINPVDYAQSKENKTASLINFGNDKIFSSSPEHIFYSRRSKRSFHKQHCFYRSHTESMRVLLWKFVAIKQMMINRCVHDIYGDTIFFSVKLRVVLGMKQVNDLERPRPTARASIHRSLLHPACALRPFHCFVEGFSHFHLIPFNKRRDIHLNYMTALEKIINNFVWR